MTKNKDSVVRIGLIQSSVSHDVEKNVTTTLSQIRRAAQQGAQVICLQELYRSKYFPTDEKADAAHLAETIPGDTTERFSQIAKKLNVVIVAPVFEVDNKGKFYNSAAVIDA